MKIVIQRVSEASVTIDNLLKDEIGLGFLILLGIEHTDSKEDADYLIRKICGLRIFNNSEGKMNLAFSEVNGKFLVISQFTLYASTKKGNRPSFIQAATPDIAVPLYNYFIQQLEAVSGTRVASGVFGADMKVGLVNDGPVTILMDSKLD